MILSLCHIWITAKKTSGVLLGVLFLWALSWCILGAFWQQKVSYGPGCDWAPGEKNENIAYIEQLGLLVSAVGLLMGLAG